MLLLPTVRKCKHGVGLYSVDITLYWVSQDWSSDAAIEMEKHTALWSYKITVFLNRKESLQKLVLKALRCENVNWTELA
jgi:hypothetical protein